VNHAPTRTRGNEVGGGEPPPLVSVVIPAHNEALNLKSVVDEVTRVLDDCQLDAEIIIVDDGSTDGTFKAVQWLCAADRRVKGIRFSRNFGKEAALLAGLRTAAGQVVITMDADLQHPPAVIPDLVKRWQQGAKVVHAVKRTRDNDPWIVRQRAATFNFLMARLTGFDLRNSSDFKLLDRIAVDAIVHALPEHRRFYRGLTAWIGYQTAAVPFDVGARDRGEAQMSLRRLLGLAVVAIVTFTAAPLRIVTLLGFLTLCLGVIVGAEAIESWWQGRAVSGFATLILAFLIVGSFIMISLGIIGEYLAKIYDEIKARPSYLIEASEGFSGPTSHLAGQPSSPPHRTSIQKSSAEADQSQR
jgi:polyisoprenyl-phosphate glycosyltransferase